MRSTRYPNKPHVYAKQRREGQQGHSPTCGGGLRRCSCIIDAVCAVDCGCGCCSSGSSLLGVLLQSSQRKYSSSSVWVTRHMHIAQDAPRTHCATVPDGVDLDPSHNCGRAHSTHPQVGARSSSSSMSHQSRWYSIFRTLISLYVGNSNS